MGRVDAFKLLSDLPAKVYFTSILGRDPTKYEWGACGLSQEELLKGLSDAIASDDDSRTPHIAVSFPHVTAVYRWGNPSKSNERETNIHRVGLGNTSELSNIVLHEPSAPFEIGCPAEIHILGQEMGFRGAAETLSKYLEMAVPIGTSTPIANANMIYLSRE